MPKWVEKIHCEFTVRHSGSFFRNALPLWLTGAATAVCALALLGRAHSFEQDCERLSAYVKESVPGAPTVVVRQSGSPVPNIVRGVFPLVPGRVTLSIAHSSENLAGWSEIQQKYLDRILEAARLPIEITDSDDAHIVVFFFKQGRTTADTPKLMSQFRALPKRMTQFPEPGPLYDVLVINNCTAAGLLLPNASYSQPTILVPVDPSDGSPIQGSENCIKTGLTKAFGVGVLRAEPTSPMSFCDECFAVDVQMAKILHQNNQTDRVHITPTEMVRRLSGGRCLAN